MKFFAAALALAVSISGAAADDSSCAAEYIVTACLASTQPKVNACTGNDWSCLCSAYTDVSTCYNNCPNDSRAYSAQQQVVAYCQAASQYATTATAAATHSGSSSASAAAATATHSGSSATSAAAAASKSSGSATGSSTESASSSTSTDETQKSAAGALAVPAGAALVAAVAALL